jgi:hypothetical protein
MLVGMGVDTGAPDNGWIQLKNVGVFILNW